MKKLILAAALGSFGLALAACGEREATTAANDAVTTEAAGTEAADGTDAAGGTETTRVVFPAGARIVEENDVTYRIDPDGTRVVLGPTESRIVVEDDVRFRVDPDGTRVRIDPRGAAIDVDLPDVDIDVRDRDKGPNR